MIFDMLSNEKLNSIVLTEKQQKYQHYRQVKLININILQLKKHNFIIKDKE